MKNIIFTLSLLAIVSTNLYTMERFGNQLLSTDSQALYVYACQHCEKAFTVKSNLEQHMQQYHGINNNNAAIIAEVASEEEYDKDNYCMNIEAPSYQPFDIIDPAYFGLREKYNSTEEESSINSDVIRNITVTDVAKLLATIQQTNNNNNNNSNAYISTTTEPDIESPISSHILNQEIHMSDTLIEEESSFEGDITQVFEVEENSSDAGNDIPTIHPLLRGLTNQKSAAKKAVANKIQKNFPCAYAGCNKSFTRQYSLDRHILAKHTEGEGFTCEICNKTCTRKGDLNSHMRIHTGEKLFACEICDKSFARKDILNGHMLTHTGEKPFTCEVCNKKFTQKSNLTSHILIHTGDKPFKCTHEGCDKSFTRKGDLARHLQICTGKQPTCDLCNKVFYSGSGLASHMHAEHNQANKS